MLKRKFNRTVFERFVLVALIVVFLQGCKGTEDTRKIPEYAFTVENGMYFEFAYEWEDLTCRSEDTAIAQVMLMEGEYDWEKETKTTGVMIYGVGNGQTELVLSDRKNGQETRWKVTVEKPEETTGKQRVMNRLLANGENTDIGDRVITKGTPESGGQVTVEYAVMDENINFYYREVQGEETVEWNLLPTEKRNGEYYITMGIGGQFITATVDLTTYDGETLVFEEGWYRVPAGDEVQPRANEISRRAYAAVNSFLYETYGETLSAFDKVPIAN